MLYICYYIMIIFKLYFHASKELRERERVILMFDILVKILKQMDMKLNLTQLKLNKCKIRDIPQHQQPALLPAGATQVFTCSLHTQ